MDIQKASDNELQNKDKQKSLSNALRQNLKRRKNKSIVKTESELNSLGIDKPIAQTRVVVAMSGGVDSSVVASMLHHEGYEVIGITLQLYDHGKAIAKKGACCAGQDISDARNVAEKLGIPYYVLNYESKFKESVVDDFVETYLAGETPIPCVKCNQTVKFRDLLDTAKELGADVLATGHYVQRAVDKNGKASLERGIDQTKDQSYFLFATTNEQLDFLRFPLGNQTKNATRKMAEEYGLEISDKPDSQDICFVPEGGYASVIEKIRPGACDAGDIVHIDGEILGKHNGIIGYTVGQRKGLGIAWHEPLYVVKLKPEERQVIVGAKSDLLVSKFFIRDINWLGDEKEISDNDFEIKTMVKWRSTQEPRAAIVRKSNGNNGLFEVELIKPEEAVAAGQACVIYDGNKMLGGGWIVKD